LKKSRIWQPLGSFEHGEQFTNLSADSADHCGEPSYLPRLRRKEQTHLQFRRTMNRPIATRKRGAPGVSPLSQQQNFNSLPYTPAPDQPSYDAGFPDWGNANGIGDLNSGLFNDPSMDGTTFDTTLNGSTGFGGATGVSNSQLIRRAPNQQLASRNTNNWQDAGGGAGNFSSFEQMEEEDGLEQKALAAKREAQSKRKQIPPFVQKLSR
jgi:heat shock transcription factor